MNDRNFCWKCNKKYPPETNFCPKHGGRLRRYSLFSAILRLGIILMFISAGYFLITNWSELVDTGKDLPVFSSITSDLSNPQGRNQMGLTDQPSTVSSPAPGNQSVSSPETSKTNLEPFEEFSVSRVLIPAGSFLIGASHLDEDLQTNSTRISRELPQHRVKVSSFWIDKTEVTNKMFSIFVQETGYKTTVEKNQHGYVYNSSNHNIDRSRSAANWIYPDGLNSEFKSNKAVSQMTWQDADAYCRWVGGRLPTEAEWEYAARGSDERVYPWGNEYNGNYLNGSDSNLGMDPDLMNYDDGYKYSAPVGSFPKGASPFGVLDMAGNVLEWVNDYYSESYYQNSPESDPQGPSSGSVHILRGGSWYSGPIGNRVSNRVAPASSDVALQNYGFRCAYDQ